MGRGACLERTLPEEGGRKDAVDTRFHFLMAEHVRESVAHGFLGRRPGIYPLPLARPSL